MYNKLHTAEQPAKVVLDALPEGGSWVSLQKNCQQVEIKTEGKKETAWQADQVQFRLPADRAETVETITKAFDGWWEYGTAWTPASDAPPSVADRLALMESTVSALVGV